MPSLRPVARNRDRIEEGRFDEDIGRGLGAAGLLAAHDAGNAARGFVVGDHAHGRIERVGLAVERQNLFAVFGHARLHIALELVGIEDMQRPAAVIGDKVGDVDQRRDRPKPDGAQPFLHPFGRRAVLHIADQSGRRNRTGRALSGAKSSEIFFGLGKLPGTV